MASHNNLGKNGELLACGHLYDLGYTIIHKNWRSGNCEIDIIAAKGHKLHFIEVKTRSTNRYGYPETAVTKRKFKNLQYAAHAYLYQNPGHKWIQYDILSITTPPGSAPEFFLLQDVFL